MKRHKPDGAARDTHDKHSERRSGEARGDACRRSDKKAAEEPVPASPSKRKRENEKMPQSKVSGRTSRSSELQHDDIREAERSVEASANGNACRRSDKKAAEEPAPVSPSKRKRENEKTPQSKVSGRTSRSSELQRDDIREAERSVDASTNGNACQRSDNKAAEEPVPVSPSKIKRENEKEPQSKVSGRTSRSSELQRDDIREAERSVEASANGNACRRSDNKAAEEPVPASPSKRKRENEKTPQSKVNGRTSRSSELQRDDIREAERSVDASANGNACRRSDKKAAEEPVPVSPSKRKRENEKKPQCKVSGRTSRSSELQRDDIREAERSVEASANGNACRRSDNKAAEEPVPVSPSKRKRENEKTPQSKVSGRTSHSSELQRDDIREAERSVEASANGNACRRSDNKAAEEPVPVSPSKIKRENEKEPQSKVSGRTSRSSELQRDDIREAERSVEASANGADDATSDGARRKSDESETDESSDEDGRPLKVKRKRNDVVMKRAFVKLVDCRKLCSRLEAQKDVAERNESEHSGGREKIGSETSEIAVSSDSEAEVRRRRGKCKRQVLSSSESDSDDGRSRKTNCRRRERSREGGSSGSEAAGRKPDGKRSTTEDEDSRSDAEENEAVKRRLSLAGSSDDEEREVSRDAPQRKRTPKKVVVVVEPSGWSSSDEEVLRQKDADKHTVNELLASASADWLRKIKC